MLKIFQIFQTITTLLPTFVRFGLLWGNVWIFFFFTILWDRSVFYRVLLEFQSTQPCCCGCESSSRRCSPPDDVMMWSLFSLEAAEESQDVNPRTAITEASVWAVCTEPPSCSSFTTMTCHLFYEKLFWTVDQESKEKMWLATIKSPTGCKVSCCESLFLEMSVLALIRRPHAHKSLIHALIFHTRCTCMTFGALLQLLAMIHGAAFQIRLCVILSFWFSDQWTDEDSGFTAQ